jgi:hypothetical protein
MTKIFLTLSLLSIYLGFAQTKISGKVIDAETKTELAFTNIGIAGTTIGTVSDIDGKFSLNLDKALRAKDTLQFSFIGYRTTSVLISQLKQTDNSIEMMPQAVQLAEVVLSSKKPKEKIIGRNHIGTGTLWSNFYIAGEKQDDKLGREMGMKFNLKGNYRLKNLNFYIGSNQYKSIKFRMNVYELEDNKPSKLLNKEDIIFDVGDIQSDWFRLDLNEYNMYLKKELSEFAVTIQWLESDKKSPDSKFFAIPFSMNPLDTKYFREKGMSEWKSSNHNLSFYLTVDSYH